MAIKLPTIGRTFVEHCNLKSSCQHCTTSQYRLTVPSLHCQHDATQRQPFLCNEAICTTKQQRKDLLESNTDCILTWSHYVLECIQGPEHLSNYYSGKCIPSQEQTYLARLITLVQARVRSKRHLPKRKWKMIGGRLMEGEPRESRLNNIQ